MANNISGALGEKFIPVLDAAYKKGILTGDLDANPSMINFINVNTVNIRKITMDGLGDVDRNGDLPEGSVTVSKQTRVLEQDRGTLFKVDPMDDEETDFIAFGMLGAEFLRTKVIPEMDAYRFAKLYENAGTKVEGDLAANTIKTALDVALAKMDDEEIPEENRRLYMSVECVTFLEELDAFDKQVNVVEVEGNVGRRVTSYKGVRVIKVPRTRFYTAITLNDGSASFGYAKTAVTGRDLNFLLVHVPAVQGAVVKYNPMNVISGEVNQTGYQDIMKFRVYHDFFVLDNKKIGVYAHYKTT